MNNSNQLCLGDFCRTLNCDRYSGYYYSNNNIYKYKGNERYKDKGAISKKENCDIQNTE